MIAYESKINIFQEMRVFPNVLGKCRLHHALGTSTLDFI